MWKVYKIDDGRIIKAGFESDDQAKDWLERRNELSDDEYDVEEMDEEEIAEFAELEEEDDVPVSRLTKVVAEEDDDYVASDATDIDYGDDEEEEEEGDLDEDEEAEEAHRKADFCVAGAPAHAQEQPRRARAAGGEQAGGGRDGADPGGAADVPGRGPWARGSARVV